MPGVLFWFILLFFRRRIYVTGFIKAAAGGTLKWRGKEEKIAEDGRFVCEKVPFGKQKWNVIMPDGTVYHLVWKLEREKKAPISFIFREKRPFKIQVGKQIRAMELVLVLQENTLLPDTSYWAVIDKKQKVYIPEGMIPPEKDGSNQTPAGLKVDKNGKFRIDEQRGMEK